MSILIEINPSVDGRGVVAFNRGTAPVMAARCRTFLGVGLKLVLSSTRRHKTVQLEHCIVV